MVLENLQPLSVMKYFEEISNIPRGSKNEKRISDYLVKFAEERNLEVFQDDFFNVIIKKKSSPGYKHIPTVILQGHIDMVCEKNQETVHDFENEGIKLKIDGDYITADGTTLGADNGIAVAFCLALLDSNIPHPSLEVVLTADEEMGMTGAQNLDISNLQGKILLNLDTEEEGEFYVSCAGGSRGVFKIPLDYTSLNENLEVFEISVRGLEGGHSGADIHKQKGNSNKILARVLNELSKLISFNLVKISGGAKSNAIPREADAVITFDKKNLSILDETIKRYDSILKDEYRLSDPMLSLNFKKYNNEVQKILDMNSTEKVISSILLHPNGIKTMSLDIPGLVESSLNLGVIESKGDFLFLKSAIRSSVESIRQELESELELLAKSLSCKFFVDSFYPAWKYKPKSKIRDICVSVYEDLTGKSPEIKAIHAGLECGLFSEKLSDSVDMISFGPNIYGAHTPEERVEINSINNVWNYLVRLLNDIKNYY